MNDFITQLGLAAIGIFIGSEIIKVTNAVCRYLDAATLAKRGQERAYYAAASAFDRTLSDQQNGGSDG